MSHHLALPKGLHSGVISNYVVLEFRNGQYYAPGKKSPVEKSDYETIVGADLVEQLFMISNQNKLLKSMSGVGNGSNKN